MRRGLGLGRGKGYRNLAGRDPHIHSQNAKGIKQPQTIRFIRPLPIQSRNRLPLQVSVIVPSTRNIRRKVAGEWKSIPIYLTDDEYAKRIDNEEKYFSKKFKGDTSVVGTGNYWDGERKELVPERNVKVQSSTTEEIYNKKRSELARHIKARQKQWKQSQVMYSVEGQDFMYPKKGWADDDKKQKPSIALV